MSRLTRVSGLVVVVLAAASLLLIQHPAKAVSGSQWSASSIISDGSFFNANSMSSADIQYFLNSQVPNCDTWGTQLYSGSTTRATYGASIGHPAPYTCLKDYFENPTTHQNNASGGSVSGGASAADIIKSAATTYGISPKVLLVLLQKEQALVADDWPFPGQYRSATGYGCPDTAPCDSEYYGFYNQVMKAAFQFKRYATNPNDYRYKAYQSNYIQWNPNAACGGTNVTIENQATAGLYNYTPYQPNTAALNNLYGSGDSCSAYGNRNFWRLYNDWFGSTQFEETLVSFKSHVSTIGWTNFTTNNGITGTTGQGKPMEAFEARGDVDYSSYNQTTGWQPAVNHGMISGTTGQSTSLNAIKINPTGTLATRYDLYYRAHVSGIGWMGWTKNGAPAGVTGQADKTVEAIEIRLVQKGAAAPGSTNDAYRNIAVTAYNPPVSISIASHVRDFGWLPSVRDGMTTGVTEQNKRIEAVQLTLTNTSGLSGTIKYSAHVQGIGWQNFVTSGALAGTTGQGKQIEAMRILLDGQLGDNYDVWYRANIQYNTWTGWAKNGAPVGSVGAGYQMEALEVRLVPKNSLALSTANSLYNPTNQSIPDDYSLSYAAHVSTIGWINGVTQNQTGGTTGQSKALEAIRIDSSSSLFGDLAITCSGYVKATGWTAAGSNGTVCGTTGQSKPLQALKLSLSGSAASKYDIYYKVHLASLGWQNWVKNGEVAGIPDGNNLEAVVIKLVPKQ